jgi:SAM-dependent methyltransferase
LIASGARRIVALDTRDFDAPAPIEIAIVHATQLPEWWRETFDVVVCISMLDHVGLDAYGNPAEAGALERVIAEIRRVTKPQGRLLVTMPIGRAQVTTHPGGGQRVFSEADLQRLFGGWTQRASAAYRLREGAYRETAVGECAEAEYLGDHAEAVICLELQKE